MLQITNKELIHKAKEVAKPHELPYGVETGSVGCVLVTDKNNIYIGVSIQACCGVGFCAEHSAIAAMVTKEEFKIKKIVAVLNDGTILSPCGRCRELMYQISQENYDTDVIIEKDKTMKLRDLLPDPWQKRLP